MSNTQLERSTAAYYHIQLEARRHGSGSRGRGNSHIRRDVSNFTEPHLIRPLRMHFSLRLAAMVLVLAVVETVGAGAMSVTEDFA